MPFAPCAAAVTVAVQLVSQVRLAAVQLFAARVVTLHVSAMPPTSTVAVMPVTKDALEVILRPSVWPLVMLPDVTHAPPLMEICAPAPVTETGVLVLMPEIVTAVAVVSVPGLAFVTFGVKSNAVGVVSAASVVTDQSSVTPPTSIVAECAVENALAEVRRTSSVWPLVILPLVTQLPPLMRIWGLPSPLTDTGVVVLIPAIVIALEASCVFRAWPVRSAKVKASGVVSAPSVVTLHVSVTPPTFTVAVMAVENDALEGNLRPNV